MNQPQLSIAAMDAGRDSAWIGHAHKAIRDICAARRGTPANALTTDAVWALLEKRGIAPPNEPRAIAAAMERAQKEGLIAPTMEHVKSSREVAHKRPIKIWRVL